jgi:hypothetical protein
VFWLDGLQLLLVTGIRCTPFPQRPVRHDPFGQCRCAPAMCMRARCGERRMDGSMGLLAVGSIVFVVGLVSVLTEWVPRWLNGQIVQPRLWGLGCIGVGICTASGWDGPHAGLVEGIRFGVMLASLVLIGIAARVRKGNR